MRKVPEVWEESILTNRYHLTFTFLSSILSFTGARTNASVYVALTLIAITYLRAVRFYLIISTIGPVLTNCKLKYKLYLRYV